MITSTGFWVFLFLLGFALLILLAMGKKTDLLNNTVVAVTISMLISLAFFTLLNVYLMDSQGLDYWYLFRE